MALSRLEKVLIGLLVLMWLAAVVYVHLLGGLRGPLAKHEYYKNAEILDQLPPPSGDVKK